MFGLTPIDLLGATAAITLGAVVQAATGLGGSLVVVPLLALTYQDEHGPALRATLAFLYVVSSVLMLAVLHLAGRFGAEHAALGLLLVPGFILGWLLAAPLASRLDRGHTRIAVLAISAVSALVLIGRSI